MTQRIHPPGLIRATAPAWIGHAKSLMAEIEDEIYTATHLLCACDTVPDDLELTDGRVRATWLPRGTHRRRRLRGRETRCGEEQRRREGARVEHRVGACRCVVGASENEFVCVCERRSGRATTRRGIERVLQRGW